MRNETRPSHSSGVRCSSPSTREGCQDVVGEEPPQWLAADAPDDFADEVLVGESVVAGGGAGLPPGFLGGQQCRGRVEVADVVEGHVLGPAGDAGGVSE